MHSLERHSMQLGEWRLHRESRLSLPAGCILFHTIRRQCGDAWQEEEFHVLRRMHQKRLDRSTAGFGEPELDHGVELLLSRRLRLTNANSPHTPQHPVESGSDRGREKAYLRITAHDHQYHCAGSQSSSGRVLHSGGALLLNHCEQLNVHKLGDPVRKKRQVELSKEHGEQVLRRQRGVVAQEGGNGGWREMGDGGCRGEDARFVQLGGRGVQERGVGNGGEEAGDGGVGGGGRGQRPVCNER